MPEELKYLAFKNWDKYQSGKKGWEWIKDYVNQNDDAELGRLSLFERGLLQELRRMRGRSGKNIPNDATHIARAIHAIGTDRARIGNALRTLIEQNILVPTNQQVGFTEERRREEKRGEDSNCDPSKEGVKDTPITPVILELQPPDEYEEERKKENEIIEKTFEHYCTATERNRLTYTLSEKRRKVALARLHECVKKTKGDYDKAAGLMLAAIDGLARSDWHMGRDPSSKGKKYCDWIDNLFKSYEQMEKWWNA